MAKCLWQITDNLKTKGIESEFDRDSKTLFANIPGQNGDIQTRFYYDEEMEVLSCQAIYMDILPTKNYAQLCELLNICNTRLGFGAFMLIDKEDLVFEINLLSDPTTPLSESNVEKLTIVPAEALDEHLPLFIEVASGKNAEESAERFYGE